MLTGVCQKKVLLQFDQIWIWIGVQADIFFVQNFSFEFNPAC